MRNTYLYAGKQGWPEWMVKIINCKNIPRSIRLLKQFCALSSVDSKQSTSSVISLIDFVKVPCFESIGDHANTVLITNGL